MTLLLVLIALACRELVTPEWQAMVARPARDWLSWITTMAARQQMSSVVIWFLAVALPSIMVLVLQSTAHLYHLHTLYFIIALLMMVVIFADRQLPAPFIYFRQQWLDTAELNADPVLLQQARQQLLLSYLDELFIPLFWFLLLGPAGLLLSYLSRLFARHYPDSVALHIGQRLQFWLTWLPARVLVLSFALAGNFVATWDYWRQAATEKHVTAQDFVLRGAVCAEAEPILHGVNPQLVLVDALARYDSLCSRSLVIWLVLLVLHIIF